MAVALAENRRTSIKAAIKRGSARARRQMNRLDEEYLGRLSALYREAQGDIEETIAGAADGTVRLEVLQDLLDQVNGRLRSLGQARNGLLEDGLNEAARLGTAPYTGALEAGRVTRAADEAARFVQSFTAGDDGLTLSDRLWRLDKNARESVGAAVEEAVIKGHSASKAAQDFMARGAPVPEDLQRQIREADAGRVGRAAGGKLMQEGGAYHHAKRVFRTEMNRAHGEAYMAGGEEVEDFAGWRFLLSPRHPRPDECDMHARANLHGLGPGVYPDRDRCPWPAHPNTLSYVEIVFADEVTDEDRAGKVNRIEWLKGQDQNTQAAVLGSKRKAAALRAGVLKEGQIGTPWKVLKERYRKQGIDIDAFKAERPPGPSLDQIITGMDPAEFQAYADKAMAHAPRRAREALRRLPPPSVRVIPSGSSYFQGNGIVLSRTYMRPQRGFHSEYDVYRHESGHYLDFWALSDGEKVGRVVSSTPKAKGGLRDSISAARQSLNAYSAAQKARRLRMREELIQRQDTNLADLFGALTRNKIGWGHSKDYLARPGFAETEVFANLFDIYSRGDRSAWEYVRTELPDLAHDFEQLLGELT